MSTQLPTEASDWRDASRSYIERRQDAIPEARMDDFCSVWTNEEQSELVGRSSSGTYPAPQDARDYYTTESAPSADVSQRQSQVQGGKSEDLAISDFNVAQGVFKKRGRTLKFTIDEFYDSCFSITFLVPETGQKWVVFIPPPEDVLLLRRLWGTSKSAEYHEKICSWLLESVVLEFNGNSIKHAQFDFEALHEACLTEMEGYVRSNSPYKNGIGKDIRMEIIEREKIRAGIRNAKVRSAANHDDYKAVMRSARQHNLYNDQQFQQSKQLSRHSRGQQRQMMAATPSLLPGVQDTHGLFTTPGPEQEEGWWGQGQLPTGASVSSIVPKSAQLNDKMMAKLNSIPADLHNSPYMPLALKPSGSAGGRGAKLNKNKRLQRMKLRAAAGEELDAIQESVQSVLAEVQGRLNRIRECVVTTTASTVPSTAGGLGLEGLDPDGRENIYDIGSPPTSATAIPRDHVENGVMTIHEREGDLSPGVREVKGGDVFNDEDSPKAGYTAQPPRQLPQGQFKRNISISSDAAPVKKRTFEDGDTPRPASNRPDFHVPMGQSSKILGGSRNDHSVSGIVTLKEGAHSRHRKNRGRSNSPERGRSRYGSQNRARNGSEDSQDNISQTASKSPVKTGGRDRSRSAARNNQQSDVLASVLAKMAVLEKEVEDQRRVNANLKESMLKEIVKARQEAIDDIMKASTMNGGGAGALESSVSLYGSVEDNNTFDTEGVANIVKEEPSVSNKSATGHLADSPLGSKNQRGRSQLMLTNTVEVLNELLGSFWKGISKKDTGKILNCLHELNVVFPSQSDQNAAIQAVSTPLLTCIRTFHNTHVAVLQGCMNFVRNACAESSFRSDGGSVMSVASAMLSDNNVLFQTVLGDAGICALFVDIAGSHISTADECIGFLKTILAITAGHSDNRYRFGKKKFCEILNLIADEYLMDESVLSLWARLIAELATRSSANQTTFADNDITEKLGFCIKAHSKHSKVMMNLCKAAALLCSGGHKSNQTLLGCKENCDFYVSVLKSSNFSAVVVESMLVIILGVIENNEEVLSNFGQCDISGTISDMLASEALGPSVHKLTLWFTSLLCRDASVLSEMQINEPLKECLGKLSTDARTEELKKLATVCVRRLAIASRASTRGSTRDGSRQRVASPPKSATRTATPTASSKSDDYIAATPSHARPDVQEHSRGGSSRGESHQRTSSPTGVTRNAQSPDQIQGRDGVAAAPRSAGAMNARPDEQEHSRAGSSRGESHQRTSSPTGVTRKAQSPDQIQGRDGAAAPASHIDFAGGSAGVIRNASVGDSVIRRPSDGSARVSSAAGARPTTASDTPARQRTASSDRATRAAELSATTLVPKSAESTQSTTVTKRITSPLGNRPTSGIALPPRSTSQEVAQVSVPMTETHQIVSQPTYAAPRSASQQQTDSYPLEKTSALRSAASERVGSPPKSSGRPDSGARVGSGSARFVEQSASASAANGRAASPPKPSSGDVQRLVSSAKSDRMGDPSASRNKVSSAASTRSLKSGSASHKPFTENSADDRRAAPSSPHTAHSAESAINPQDYAEFGFADTAPEAVTKFDSVPIMPVRQVESDVSGTSADGRQSQENVESFVSEPILDDYPERGHHKRNRRHTKVQSESTLEGEESSKPQRKKKKKRNSVMVVQDKLPSLDESVVTSHDAPNIIASEPSLNSVDPTATLIGENSIGQMSMISAVGVASSLTEPVSDDMQALLRNMETANQTNDASLFIGQVEKASSLVLTDQDVGMFGKALIEGFQRFEGDKNVLLASITATAAICTPNEGDVEPRYQGVLVNLGMPAELSSLLRRHHSQPECAGAILKMILVLCANNVVSREAFAKLPSFFSGFSATIDGCITSSAVTTLWSRTISELCDGVPENQSNFGSAGACNRILKILKKHQKNPKVITNSCKACVRLCKNKHAQNQEALATEVGAQLWVKLLAKDGLNPALSESRLRAFFAVIAENELAKTSFRGIDLVDALAKILLEESVPELVQQLVLCAVYDCANDGVLAEEFKSNDVIRTVNELISSRSSSSENTRKYANLCVQKLFVAPSR